MVMLQVFSVSFMYRVGDSGGSCFFTVEAGENITKYWSMNDNW